MKDIRRLGVFSITVDVGNPCDKEVSLFKMSGPSIHAGEMRISWYKTTIRKRDEPCDLIVRGYYLYDRLAFQFEGKQHTL